MRYSPFQNNNSIAYFKDEAREMYEKSEKK